MLSVLKVVLGILCATNICPRIPWPFQTHVGQQGNRTANLSTYIKRVDSIWSSPDSTGLDRLELRRVSQSDSNRSWTRKHH
ncbi:MAG: hypothetical protein GY820_14830 [Gammaproteobacteria bacterium]|nr:hypothetical protein [Gammaproteobacteria bacterium]